MNRLEKLIFRIENPDRIANEDVFDTVKGYWDDVVSGYWQDTDDELADELGVTPVALSELLEVNRHTFSYANIGGNSSVRGYDHGEDWMVVMFSDGSRYLYTLKSTDRETLDYMRRLAMTGKGLNSYITRIVGPNYAGRNYKGTITIKPGMEHFNPEGYRRLLLLQAFRNTMNHNTISSEAFMHNTLNKYKQQIIAAGTDGLDPIARQILTVGLEAMGYTTKPSLESINPSEPVNDTSILGMMVDHAINCSMKRHGSLNISNEEMDVEAIKEWFKKLLDWLLKKGKETVDKIKTGELGIERKIKHIEALTKAKVQTELKVKLPSLLSTTCLDSSGDVSSQAFGQKTGEAFQIIKDVRGRLDVAMRTKTLSDFGNANRHLDKELEEANAKLKKVLESFYSSEPEEITVTQATVMEFRKIADHINKTRVGESFASTIEDRYNAVKKFGNFNDVDPDLDKSARQEFAATVGKVNSELGNIANAYNHMVNMVLGTIEKIMVHITGEKSSNESYFDKKLSPILDMSIDVETNNFMNKHVTISKEDLLSEIKKFFSPSKDKDIYDTVNKGFLQDLAKEVKKYTNPTWIKTRGLNPVKTIEVNGANLIGDYDEVVSNFIAECKANRAKQHEACETAFKNIDEVIGMIESRKLTSSDNVRKAITIMQATRQIKAPKVKVPKVNIETGQVKTLTADEIADKANKLLELFTTLGADTTYVDRWNKNYINSRAWMDWKYVGKANSNELYSQVKDAKFTELYAKTMEHVYDMSYIGAEFHQLKPYVMAMFQLIEKSVED